MTPTEVVPRQVSRHFSAHAVEYDRYAVVQKQVVRRLLTLLPSDAADLGPVLDIGCGTGELARQLSTRFPRLPLAIADIAHGMTCCAATQLAGVTAFDADAQALPVGPTRFGMVVSSSMYQWVNDLPGAFTENHRVLRPGGAFVFALFVADTLKELRVSYQQALDELGNPYPSHMQKFVGVAEVRQALASAGFEAVRLETAYEVEHHPDVVTLLKNIKHIGAQNAAKERPAGLGLRRVTQRMIELYTAIYATGGTVPATYQVVYGVGRKKD
ncbi:MAG: methyltransferase domain-containing protein [Desulfuromonadales bacterium]|nr:methyltransferase domain-containing protein [Desulfuromonadales bacterium]